MAVAVRGVPSEESMTYQISVPGAAEGDRVTATVHGSALSVTWNDRVLARHEYRISCTHARDTAGCPACVHEGGGLELVARLDELAHGVDMQPPRGTWGAHAESPPSESGRVDAALRQSDDVGVGALAEVSIVATASSGTSRQEKHTR
jgi:hypothetical protein